MEKLLSKELRLKGITRDEAAKKIGVTKATISYWVNGKHPISTIGVKVFKKMGITNRAIRWPSLEV